MPNSRNPLSRIDSQPTHKKSSLDTNSFDNDSKPALRPSRHITNTPISDLKKTSSFKKRKQFNRRIDQSQIIKLKEIQLAILKRVGKEINLDDILEFVVERCKAEFVINYFCHK